MYSLQLKNRKLRKYVGPADTSDYTEADKMKIVSGVKMITMRSGLCYDKFSRLFTEYNSTSQQPFYEYFQVTKDILRVSQK